MSALAWDRPLGRLARLPLRLIPRELAVPVLSGPNRGPRWIVGAGNHSCWLGTYEQTQLAYVSRAARTGLVFDVGAHAGFYTLALARRCSVIAVEPAPANADYLRRHVALNGLKNVQVIEAAACDQSGVVRFAPDGYMGHIAEQGTPVRALRLDELGDPTAIKMDVEGAEAAALRDAERILSIGRADVFLSLHGVCDEEALAILQRHGYRMKWLSEAEVHAIPPR